MVNKTKQNSLISPILVGRCDCDEHVKFPFYWCEEIINKSEQLGIKVIDLKKENFSELKFKKNIEEQNPKLILLNGHGDEFSAMGYNKEPVLIVNKNDYLLKEKIAHVLSCKTGAFLGQSAIDKGCKGYIGYHGQFRFWSIDNEPTKDGISRLFMEAVNIVALTLIEGGGIEKAYEESQGIYDKYIGFCMRQLRGEEEPKIKREYLVDILMVLRNNKKSQIYISV